jgi:hypothetical protein
MQFLEFGQYEFASRRSFRRADRLTLTSLVSLAWPFLRASRALAQQEDHVGYRHELYQEDNDRIHVDTDSALFDIGLGSHVRLNGNFVVDSISGATPTGAPPQSQWPFPSYNALFQTALGQAYTSLYNQFVAANQIYVDAGYETYQQMTNAAAQYAQGAAPGVATNSANASYTSLTNNPNYRNTSVPLTQMHDHRDAFSIGVPINFGPNLLTPSFSYSEEHDYISFGGALNYSLDLNNKNTTLNFGWSHNSDSVRDDKFIWQDKQTDDFFVGLVQLLSRRSYLTLNLTFGYERGYLSDPYRGVMPAANFPQNNPDDAALIPEKRPDTRARQIAYVSWTQFVDPMQGSVELGYRFFHDSWDIFAHTFDVAWHQKIGRQIVVSPIFRYYLQSQAAFYYVLVPDYNNLPEAYSADYRLSHLQTFSYGVDFTWRVHKHVSLDASYMRYEMEGLDGITSQSAYPSANVFAIGLRIWF